MTYTEKVLFILETLNISEHLKSKMKFEIMLNNERKKTMTENKNTTKKQNSLPQAYIDSIAGLWQNALDLYYNSPNPKSDFWKLTSITCFFIRAGLKRQNLLDKTEQLKSKIEKKEISAEMANILARSLKKQIENREQEKVFFQMLDNIKDDYEKALDYHLEQFANLESDILTYKTFDELKEMMNKPKAETNTKQALDILEGAKWEILNDI